ncbi:MAG: hypothetical protein H6862_02615 [Rhodospirillales bacterium]|nr:hypothetical protein [Rhodospirillales bacterium]
MKHAFREAVTPAAPVPLSDRALARLERTFNDWLATHDPVSTKTIRRTLEKLGFIHRTPRGGSTHSTLHYPGGLVIGLIAETDKATTQYEAAQAGLALIRGLRTERAPPAPPPAPEPAPLPPDLFTLIPPDYDLSPLDGFEDTYVVRARTFPQIGAVVYAGASPQTVSEALHDIDQTVEGIEDTLSQAADFEFDIEHTEGILHLRHRVHDGLSYTVFPYDAFSDEKNSDILQGFQDFIKAIQETDALNEATRARLFSIFGIEESGGTRNPDGSPVISCKYSRFLTDEVRKLSYTPSPQGRLSIQTILKLQDEIYADVFNTLKKDAKRFYGLETNQPQKGFLRIWHPYCRSIDFEILDLRTESLIKSYERAVCAGTPESCRSSQSLLNDKMENLRTVLNAREKSVRMINDLAEEITPLLLHARASTNIKISSHGGTKVGETGKTIFSYISDQGEQNCSLEYRVCAITEDQKKDCARRNIPIPKSTMIPRPKDVVALHRFLMEELKERPDFLLPGRKSRPPFPSRAAQIVAEDEGMKHNQQIPDFSLDFYMNNTPSPCL